VVKKRKRRREEEKKGRQKDRWQKGCRWNFLNMST
jgi:hypothetical protein